MAQRIIAIDQSTSSTKALLFDEECKMLARTNVDHHQYYPQTGWVEHDHTPFRWPSLTNGKRQWYGTRPRANPLPTQ